MVEKRKYLNKGLKSRKLSLSRVVSFKGRLCKHQQRTMSPMLLGILE